MSRLITWFSTAKGKIFTRTCVGITGISIFGIQIAVNGPLQENFKEMIQIYENGKPKPLSMKVKSLVNEVSDVQCVLLMLLSKNELTVFIELQ
ncbi:unnamed protein product [Larinioides sclopetarius]|uniref:Uncharacterized protein n=1 Tax=Larinioides sclopetarius TaxID=280406 RepID=A0AAV1ZUA4_9ARAC